MAQEIVHLDTSFLVAALKKRSRETVVLERLLSERVPVKVSVVAWAEFLCGPLDDRDRKLATQMVGEPEPLIGEDCVRAADLFNKTGRRRGSLPDCLIAASALRDNARLATANLGDFRRFAGLELVT